MDQALLRYRDNRFTDGDVTRCTGLSVRAWRELIKHRAVKTTTERRGPGRVRLCDAIVFKRAALISALNRAGLSLAVAGRIAYFLPFHTMLFSVCDPCTVLLENSAGVDPKTGLPPRVEQPKVDWFDPIKPAKAAPDSDWLIEIYDRRFVGAIYNVKDGPTMFGDLRDEGTRFVAWFPFHQLGQFRGGAIEEIARELLPYSFDFVAQWDDPIKWAKELNSLNYEFEKHDTDTDPLCVSAQAGVNSPLIKTTINITLALRRALRCYLGIEPDAPIL